MRNRCGCDWVCAPARLRNHMKAPANSNVDRHTTVGEFTLHSIINPAIISSYGQVSGFREEHLV